MKKLHKNLTTVTSFSKIVAAILFIWLPLFTFFLGMNYQASIDAQLQSLQIWNSQNLLVDTNRTPALAIYENNYFTIEYPSGWKVKEINETIVKQQGFIFEGGEGSVNIVWGEGFSGDCDKPSEKIEIDGEQLSTCHFMSGETEVWEHIYPKKNGVNFAIRLTSRAPTETNKEVILTIAKSIRFK